MRRRGEERRGETQARVHSLVVEVVHGRWWGWMEGDGRKTQSTIVALSRLNLTRLRSPSVALASRASLAQWMAISAESGEIRWAVGPISDRDLPRKVLSDAGGPLVSCAHRTIHPLCVLCPVPLPYFLLCFRSRSHSYSHSHSHSHSLSPSLHKPPLSLVSKWLLLLQSTSSLLPERLLACSWGALPSVHAQFVFIAAKQPTSSLSSLSATQLGAHAIKGTCCPNTRRYLTLLY